MSNFNRRDFIRWKLIRAGSGRSSHPACGVAEADSPQGSDLPQGEGRISIACLRIGYS